MRILLLVLVVFLVQEIRANDEITAEQREIMERDGLSLPPILSGIGRSAPLGSFNAPDSWVRVTLDGKPAYRSGDGKFITAEEYESRRAPIAEVTSVPCKLPPCSFKSFDGEPVNFSDASKPIYSVAATLDADPSSLDLNTEEVEDTPVADIISDPKPVQNAHPEGSWDRVYLDGAFVYRSPQGKFITADEYNSPSGLKFDDGSPDGRSESVKKVVHHGERVDVKYQYEVPSTRDCESSRRSRH